MYAIYKYLYTENTKHLVVEKTGQRTCNMHTKILAV